MTNQETGSQMASRCQDVFTHQETSVHPAGGHDLSSITCSEINKLSQEVKSCEEVNQDQDGSLNQLN